MKGDYGKMMNENNLIDLAERFVMQETDDNKLVRLGLGVEGLDKAYEEAHRIAGKMEDKYVDGTNLSVDILHVSDDLVLPVLLITDGNRLLNRYPFSSRAFSQLCDRVGMGATAYMKKCLKMGTSELVPLNLNTWIKKNSDKQFLVRLYDGQVQAVLTSSYGIFDHVDALECLDSSLGGRNKYQIEAFSVTPDNMQIRMVDTESVILRDPHGKTDTSVAGLVFRNGQTGWASASIEFMVYTFACTNGLIVAPDKGIVYYRKHIRIGKEDFIEEVTKTLDNFPAYVDEARKDLERARMYRARMDERTVEYLKRGLSIGDETVDKIKDVMNRDWDTTMWGLSGAITQVAQEYNAQRQYDFERFAGRLLDSPRIAV